MARELNEEVGLKIDPNSLSTPLVMHYKDNLGERIYVFFKITKWTGEAKNNEPKKCSEIAWFSKNNLPENMVLHIKEAMLKLEKSVCYTEFGF